MLGIALVGVLSIGANSSFTNQALNIERQEEHQQDQTILASIKEILVEYQ